MAAGDQGLGYVANVSHQELVNAMICPAKQVISFSYQPQVLSIAYCTILRGTSRKMKALNLKLPEVESAESLADHLASDIGLHSMVYLCKKHMICFDFDHCAVCGNRRRCIYASVRRSCETCWHPRIVVPADHQSHSILHSILYARYLMVATVPGICSSDQEWRSATRSGASNATSMILSMAQGRCADGLRRILVVRRYKVELKMVGQHAWCRDEETQRRRAHPKWRLPPQDLACRHGTSASTSRQPSSAGLPIIFDIRFFIKEVKVFRSSRIALT
jgi:hypothetical protein